MSENIRLSGPLTLRPTFVERIWGTQDPGPWYPASPKDRAIGEVWLTAEDCFVEGPNATLGELAAAHPAQLGNEDGEGFPLLIKILYPREKLSVQVHPDDAQARAMHGEPRGKTECWYVLSAEPGASVAVGFNEPLSGEDLRAAIRDGSIEAKLRLLPVKAGDMVFVEAGTVHAIGPGMVVLEVQEYSDITYRLWDYGRPRELHVDSGVAVSRKTAAGLVAPTEMEGFTRLVLCDYFRVDRFTLQPSTPARLQHADELQILIALGEGASVVQGEVSLQLSPGQAVLLPAVGIPSLLQSSQATEVIRVLQ